MPISLALRPMSHAPARWWPENAVYAADFIARRYMRDGVEIPAAAAFSFSRASARLAETAQGDYVPFEIDQPAMTTAGLSIEPDRLNLNTRLRHSNASGWVTNNAASVTPLVGTFANLFNDAALVASSGSTTARRETPTFEVVAGTTYCCTFWYRAGSSNRVRLSCRTGSDMSGWSGPVGAPDTKFEQAGPIGPITLAISPTQTYRASFTWVASTGSSGVRIGLGPGSTTAGEDVIVLGAQIEAGSWPSSAIPSTGVPLHRAADQIVFQVPSSASQLHVEYLDGSVTIPLVPGMTAPSAAYPILRVAASV